MQPEGLRFSDFFFNILCNFRSTGDEEMSRSGESSERGRIFVYCSWKYKNRYNWFHIFTITFNNIKKNIWKNSNVLCYFLTRQFSYIFPYYDFTHRMLSSALFVTWPGEVVYIFKVDTMGKFPISFGSLTTLVLEILGGRGKFARGK